MAGLVTDQLLARAGEVAPRLLRHRGHEARANEAMGQQIRQPGGVIHVGLAPRHRLDVPGIGQHEFEAVGKHGPDRLPVHAGGLHGDDSDARAGQPPGQALQLCGGGREGLDKAGRTAGLGDARARHDGVAMDVEPGTTWVENVPDRLLRTAPAGSPG